MTEFQRKSVEQIKAKKVEGRKITMLTAYDYPFAKLIDEAGVDIILVGDSLANVVLGLATTPEVGMQEMLHHCKAVNRAVKRSLLVGDMPYESYQQDVSASVENARRFVDEAGCGAVKLEWFDQCLQVAGKIIDSGIPVMGHVGLTPQTAEATGGMKVQGRESSAAAKIIKDAKSLEEVGCFSVVLECIPKQVAEIITAELSIPTIGIGAGSACDGQVLVSHDLLGLFTDYRPKFIKRYVNLSEVIAENVKSYCRDVEEGVFPGEEHSFQITAEELADLKKGSCS